MHVQVAFASADVLGESACWSTATRQVYWIDGDSAAIHCWDPYSNIHESIDLHSAPIGMIAETSQRDVFAISDCDGVSIVNFRSGAKHLLADPENGREGVNYNDGKVDLQGRLWIGTNDKSELEPRGTLWLLESGRSPRLAESGMAVVNGPALSPDGTRIYISDSTAGKILTYRICDGSLRDRRIFAQFRPSDGLPDGLAVDADGCIWCAHWDGGRISRFSPSGECLAVIPVPVARVTSVAFGGSNLVWRSVDNFT